MGREPSGILFLSDTPEELEAARAAGLATALVRRDGDRAPAPGSHSVVADFREVHLV
jgi:methionine salvage enolase-phosphatase E1